MSGGARLRMAGLIATVGLLTLVIVSAFMLVQPVRGAATSMGAGRRVEARRLQTHVETISRTFAPRDHTHPEILDRVAAYVRAEMERAGARVADQVYALEDRSYRNVIASFGPEGGARIVVGAHYDTAGPLPGADDNASGVAGLLELARLLAGGPAPASRIDLVAYTLEEPPFFRSPAMGSAVHAASLRQQGVQVRAMLSLEMIGYFTDAPGSQSFPSPLLRLLYPDQGNFVTVVGRFSDVRLLRRVKAAMKGASDLDVRSMSGPAWIPGIDFSDQLSYWAHGYPAIMITDTGFYRNDRYHTDRDTPDTLDYGRMAKVVAGVYQAVLALSDGGDETRK